MTSRNRRYPLARDHHIPLRRQLAADLEAGIRDGHVAPGARLPSSRELARHLEVDRGTVSAAFARLRRRRLVDTCEGRQPRATLPLPDWLQIAQTMADERRAVETASQAAVTLLRAAHASGLPRWELLEELERIVGSSRCADPLAVTLYEPRPGLRAVLTAEVEETCGIHVDPIPSLRRTPWHSPVIVRRELLARLPRARNLECLPIALAGGTRERGVVRRRVRRGLVVLLSGSATVRDFASELAVREFARGVSFAALDPDRDVAATTRALAAARLVFYDRVSARHATSTPVPSVRIRLIPPQDVEGLRRYLGTTEGGRMVRPTAGPELEWP